MDRDPMGMLATLHGEESMKADAKRREASVLRQQADDLERQAAWHDERRAWFTDAINALEAQMETSEP